MEDYAYILDYLPQGRPEEKSFKRTPLAIAVGESEFKLFELIPKPNVSIIIGERVYIGKDMTKREKIEHVKRRIAYTELTHAAESELPYVLEEIVKNREQDFIKFFNEAHPITTRLHMLELLPGLGKKTMWAILEERKKGPFKDFEDLRNRVKLTHHPVKLIVNRIIYELQHRHEKYKIFVAR
ncbi:putative RNA-binding protein [Aciduliprofundum sp. MAR08-339]|uniref:DUF655 domain-containing protein n=1 Tax=Aciduliprofundum sp. (strain MAR08-339) TaxID=673860 RepID=UPI0002A4BAC0|nr:putative RNA-binding protein [Aciduliprofundum sp. MAR08-339]